jgi:DNA-binding transcriptional MerR regulator
MSSGRDISIQDIEQLLESRQTKINDMENMTKGSREKLKKINKKLDEQEKQLIEIISNIALSQREVDNLDDFNVNNDQVFAKKIKDILNNMRKIRLSLADIIRKG